MRTRIAERTRRAGSLLEPRDGEVGGRDEQKVKWENPEHSPGVEVPEVAWSRPSVEQDAGDEATAQDEEKVDSHPSQVRQRGESSERPAFGPEVMQHDNKYGYPPQAIELADVTTQLSCLWNAVRSGADMVGVRKRGSYAIEGIRGVAERRRAQARPEHPSLKRQLVCCENPISQSDQLHASHVIVNRSPGRRRPSDQPLTVDKALTSRNGLRTGRRRSSISDGNK